MLSEAALEAAGPNCARLHAYFMEHSKDKLGFPAKVAQAYFLGDGDLMLNVAFNDVYDLITLDALDVSFLRLWTLKMMEKAAEMQCSVGFLDPQVFTATVISHQPNTVIQAIENAMKNDYVVGAYNTGGHWVTMIICMQYKEVWYLDSSKQVPGRKFPDVRAVANWAFTKHMEEVMKGKKKKPKTKPTLKHKLDVPCAQQPSGSLLCGFYVAFNVLRLLGEIPTMKKAADFKAALTVSIEDLKPVREMLCEFILKETLDPKGNFYVDPTDAFYSAFYL